MAVERTGSFTEQLAATREAIDSASFDLAGAASRHLLAALRARIGAAVDDGRVYAVRIDPTQATRTATGVLYSRTAYVALADPDSAELGEWAIPSADLVRDARGVGDLAECDGKIWRVASWAWQRISNEEALSDEGDEGDKPGNVPYQFALKREIDLNDE